MENKIESHETKQDPLIEAGWQRRGTFDDPKLSEVVEMYEDLGFLVRLEPMDPDEEEGCVACMRLVPDLFKTIYTKRK